MLEVLIQQQNIGLITTILQLIVIPAAVGTIVATVAFRRRMGQVTVKRALSRDSNAKPVWQLVVRCIGNPANNCRIRVGSRQLRWQGVSSDVLDIGTGGIGVALVPPETDPDVVVMVKTGSFPIFRKSFRSLEEAVISQ